MVSPPLDELIGRVCSGGQRPAMGACRTSRSEPPDRGWGQPDPGREERSATYGQDPSPTGRGANTLGGPPNGLSTNNRRLTCRRQGRYRERRATSTCTTTTVVA